MELDLFAGIPVRDFAASLPWYERLLGAPPSFFPHDTEAVWELAEHRFVYVVQLPERAGNAVVTIFAGDLEKLLAGISERGLDPAVEETYGNGVRKITYQDPDENQVAFGGVSAPA